MALSNWDTLSFGPDGLPGKGELVGESITISFYKNWLHTKGSDNLTIYEGHIGGHGWDVYAKRGPQSSIMALVFIGDKAMVGVAGYGYESDIKGAIEQFGLGGAVYEAEGDYSHGSCNSGSGGGWVSFVEQATKTGDTYEFVTVAEFSKDDFELTSWVGIKPETLAALREWVTTLAKEEHLTLPPIEWENALRFNQGDAYFASHLGDDIPATAVGEAEATIMSHLLDNLNTNK